MAGRFTACSFKPFHYNSAKFCYVDASFDWNSDFMYSVFGVLRYLASMRAVLSVWKAEHSSI